MDKLIEAWQEEQDQRDLQDREYLLQRLTRIEDRLMKRGVIKRRSVISGRKMKELESVAGADLVRAVLDS